MKTKMVPCFPLESVLTAEQMEAARPFMRATFSETWTACCSRFDGTDSHYLARMTLRAADPKSHLGTHHLDSTPAEGRAIEGALYARAKALGVKPIMAPPRSR